jgi:hypothetical protein
MGSNIITGISAAVGAAASITVQPPVGEAWVLNDFSSDTAFVSAVPDLQVSLTNGATAGIILMDPTTDPGKRTRQTKLYITNAMYASIKNTAGGNANIGWFGEKVNVNNVRTGTLHIGATSFGTIRPPAGETWIITEWGTTPFTVAGDINPAVQIGLTNGTLVASRFILPTESRAQDKQSNIIINHDVYLNLYATPAVEFYYSAIRIPQTCISSVQDVVGSANLDIIPPAGDEYAITDVGAETWAGGGVPADYPDINVFLRTSVNSELLVAGAGASARWNTESVLKIDTTHFLRIVEVSTANNEVCVSGYLQRSY